MFACRLFLSLVLLVALPGFVQAFDDGPPISITSPDNGTTFARAQIKSHTLLWYPNRKMLVACVTFTDSYLNNGQPSDDTHYFQLPGVTLDAAKGIFTATSARGEVIPVARYKKMLFIKSIEVLPNANVKIMYPAGEISVMLVALSPSDPALRPPPPGSDKSNPDGTHDIDLKSLMN
jgi:hypothetical protein